MRLMSLVRMAISNSMVIQATLRLAVSGRSPHRAFRARQPTGLSTGKA